MVSVASKRKNLPSSGMNTQQNTWTVTSDTKSYSSSNTKSLYTAVATRIHEHSNVCSGQAQVCGVLL